MAIALGLSERSTNLASLIPENAIDEKIQMKSLNGWIKEDQVGHGAYGEVWRYSTPKAEIPIAAGKHLKLSLWNLSDKQKDDLKQRVNSFVHELNVMHNVSSKYSERLVQFHGCYVDSKKFILFTEFMTNGSIKDHIIQLPLDEATALKYTFQATQGLNFLHHYPECRIVHRDIKCDNLLLTTENNVKLADFGLAFNNLKVDNNSFTMSQSAPSGFAGTTIFAAPEVLLGTTYGRRADIWSLGCTLVEMLTTLPPHADYWLKHKERAHFLFLEQARAEPAHQLQYVGKQLVPHASSIVQRLLDCLFIKNMQHRPRSEDVLEIFESPSSSSSSVGINETKLNALQHRINEDALS